MNRTRHSRLLSSLAAFGLMLSLLGSAPATSTAAGEDHHVRAELVAVGGSGVSGHVNLEARPKEGTHIQVVAFGLEPGVEYVSLYYDDNPTCTLPGDELGMYTANAHGVGTTNGEADEDLDEIQSVSVRIADTLELVACARTIP
jgi:hypothetical protein